jgi:hypothetical protein
MASFASLARSTGFQSLGISRAERSSSLQPLPVAVGMSPRSGAPSIRRLGAGAEGEENQAPQGPPAPSREELEEALAAKAQAEQALAEAQAELTRLRGELQAEQRASLQIGEALQEALDSAQAEMRSSYAEVVMAGCRRLLGSLSESEAIFHAQLDTVSEQLVLESDVVLRVSPSHKRAAEAAIFGRMGWSVEVDPTMDAGCIAVCRNSLVDAQLETALDGMESAVRAWLAQDAPGQPSK